jgi:hypothetical protein
MYHEGMAQTKVEQTTMKAKQLFERLLAENPEYTGSLVLNFHRGNLAVKAETECRPAAGKRLIGTTEVRSPR